MNSYLNHFGLQAEPFRIAPDPDFMFWSSAHRMAGTVLEAAIEGGQASVLLVGDAGTGKSTLLRYFFESADLRVHQGFVWHPTLLEHAFHGTILAAFGHPHSGEDKDAKKLSELLRQQAEQGNHSVLFIDDAQTLSAQALERLRDCAKDMPRLTVVLAGPPSLSSDDPKRQPFAGSPTIKLPKLSETQTREYMRHRLRLVGCDQEIFDQAAYKEIFKATKGTPELVNALCEKCLVFATDQSLNSISAEVVILAANEADSGFLAAEPSQNGSELFVAPARPPKAAGRPPGTVGDETYGHSTDETATGSAPSSGARNAGHKPGRAETAAGAQAAAASLGVPPPRQSDGSVGAKKGRKIAVSFGVGVVVLLVIAAVVPTDWRAPSEPEVTQEALADLSAPIEPLPAEEAVVAQGLSAEALADLARNLPDDPEERFRFAVLLADKDPQLALVAYSHAAAQGHPRAAYYLGQIFEIGDGVPVDIALARAWYQKAAIVLDVAQSSLARLSSPERGAFLPPQPLMGRVTADARAELSWTSSEGPDPEAYVIEFAGASSSETLGSMMVFVSAALATLPPGAERWRVISTGRNSPELQASDWQPLIRP